MTMYVGLTNDPSQRRIEHGNPTDWWQTGPFTTEEIARDWERRELEKPDTKGGTGGAGWKYGDRYTIKPWTRQ